MSAKATFWAWSLRGLTSSQKLTLLCLSDNHNQSTGQCNPSISFIADKTGLDRKTVMRALDDLEIKGFLKQYKKFGLTNNFYLHTSTEIGTGVDEKTSTNIGTSTKIEPVPILDTTSTNIGHEPVPILGHKSKTESKKNLKHVCAHDGKFLMSLDWRPNPDYWEGISKSEGLSAESSSGTMFEQMLASFKNYWVDEPKSKSERQWQTALVAHIKRQYEKTKIIKTPSEGEGITDEQRRRIVERFSTGTTS